MNNNADEFNRDFIEQVCQIFLTVDLLKLNFGVIKLDFDALAVADFVGVR